MAFINEIKQGNITENWLFQLGYFNGDAQGNGDGGFSAVTQASDGSANEVKVAITSTSATSIDVDDTTVFTVGDFIQIDDEVMKITALTDSDTLAVTRGEKGTTAATHLINKQVYWHNFFPIALSDITDNETFYRGAVLNKPSIRESIDLATSTSKSSNISIDIPDFSYQGSPISRELFGGTRKYINQTVKVFCKVGSGTKVQIGSFRLNDLSSNGDTLQLSLVSHRPWDFLSFPQDKSNTKVYVPVVYGDFTPNTHGVLTGGAGASFCNSKNLFPCPNLKYGIFERTEQKDHIYFVYPKQYSSSNADPHFYDSNIDLFIPFTGQNSPTNTVTAQQVGVHAVGVNIDMERGFFLIRPLSPSGATSGSGSSSWSNVDQSVNGNTGNGATASCNPATSDNGVTNTATATLSFDIPTVDGELSGDWYLYIKGSVDHNHTSQTTSTSLKVGETIVATQANSDGVVNTPGTGTNYTIDGVSGYARVNIAAETTINIRVQTSVNGANPGAVGAANGSGTINDIIIQQKCKNDIENEKMAALDKLSQLEAVYCGGDGLTESWTGSNNDIKFIHEAHRDLLIRFSGMTTDTPEGWGNGSSDGLLDHAKDWRIRYWNTEPIDLKKALEMLQYEGGFIFRFKADGSPEYIFIKDSYSSTDATLTKSDISDVSVKPSPMSELLTKMEISYRKHPAGKDYLTDVTFTNATARNAWNIKAKENIKQVQLNAYVGDTNSDNDIPTSTIGGATPNDDWGTYYDNIFGDIKLIVNCMIVNPKYYNLEVGDVVDFSNMYPETPFGYNSASWSGIKFMITDLNRTLGKMQITARQIT